MKRVILVMVIALPAIAYASVPESSLMPERMMFLVLQLGVLLLATRLGNLLFERCRLPGVLGELAAGIVIGPHGLGSLSLPGFPHGIFPGFGVEPVSPELYGFCSVAAIVLLFMVGLETDVGLFLRYSVAGSAVGIGGVAASFLIGDFVAVALSDYVFGTHLSFFDGPALFLGVVSTATSVGITARILSENEHLDSPEGVTILSGAVVDDVCGIILLTIVLGLSQASGTDGSVDWVNVCIIGGKAVTVWLVASLLGILGARHLGRCLKSFRDHSSIAVMALSFALMLGALFEEAGLAMIIGAYVMGLSLSRTDLSQLIREKLAPVYAFLVPLFFGVMGMLVNVAAVGTWRMLFFALVYTLLAVVAKMVGSGLPSMVFGFNLRGAIRIGTGMIPRGEVALIVAGIGLSTGALSHESFGIAVIMTVCTTVVVPPFLTLFFRSPVSGLRRPKPESESGAAITYDFPSPSTAEWVFSKLGNVFHSEGFFVHMLESEGDLMQARRENVVLTVSLEESRLVCHCKEADQTFVNVAVLEVLGDLRLAVRGLSKPVEAAQFARTINHAVPDTEAIGQIREYLQPELLVPRLKASNKTAIINELLEILVRNGRVKDPQTARRDLLHREEQMSTAMQLGIAIPHARTTAVDKLCCVVGLCPEGIEFGSLDGAPSRIFVLTLSPLDQPSPHLQFMALLSRALTPAACEKLLNARSSSRMFDILTHVSIQAPDPGEAIPPGSEPVPAAIHQARRSALDLQEYLDPGLIVPSLKAQDKLEAINELLNTVTRHCASIDRECVLEEILKREQMMPTGLEDGIAVPHCHWGNEPAPVCAIGIAKDGLDFGSLDGRPSQVIVLTVAPDTKHVPYVQFMATLVQAIEKCDRKQLLDADRPETVIELILAGAKNGLTI